MKSLEALESDNPVDAILDWLRQRDNEAAIAIVALEPTLGRLAGFLTTGKANRVLALKAHGVCCLDLDEPPSSAGAMLKWLLTPAQLKRLKF